jgi:hypothetical protein
MALTDIVHRVIELCEVDGTVSQTRAVSAGVPLVMADPEAVGECVRETVWRRVGAVTKRVARQLTAAPNQLEMFPGLRSHYAVDTDGRVLKQTKMLSRLEFERVIDIREKQVADDVAHLGVLLQARRKVRRLWDANPALTFGEVEALFRQSDGRSDAA